MKRVRFNEAISISYVPSHDESRDGLIWMQQVIDRGRFQRRIKETSSIISPVLFKKRIKYMNYVLEPILKNHCNVYLINKM